MTTSAIFGLKLLCLFVFCVIGLPTAINTARGHGIRLLTFVIVVSSAIGFCLCQGWLAP